MPQYPRSLPLEPVWLISIPGGILGRRTIAQCFIGGQETPATGEMNPRYMKGKASSIRCTVTAARGENYWCWLLGMEAMAGICRVAPTFTHIRHQSFEFQLSPLKTPNSGMTDGKKTTLVRRIAVAGPRPLSTGDQQPARKFTP